MKIVVAGGTGFIGRALIPAILARGHQVVLLTRGNKALPMELSRLPGEWITVADWDAGHSSEREPGWFKHIDNAGAVINLAGEPVGNGRWTAEKKRRIEESRINATAAIVKAIACAERKPEVLINASGVGYYGSVPEGDVDERHLPADDFFGRTCAKWEHEALRAAEFGTRVVLLRQGIVLEKDGGALKKMITPFRFFIGGPLGSGRQWMPWVHRDDLIGIISFVLDHPEVNGALNVSTPQPVRMKEFSAALGRAMHRPSWAPVPSFILKILFGEMASIILTGQRAIPRKLQEAGYPFRYPALSAALEEIMNS